MKRFYHTCPSTDTASILQHGLLRSKSSLWRASGGAIYLSKLPNWLCKEPGRDILQVDLPDDFIKKTKIWHIDSYDGGLEWQFVVWSDIPPQFISRKKRECPSEESANLRGCRECLS